MPIGDYTAPDDYETTRLEDALRPRDLILGDDGCVHVGDVVQKMGATLMQTSCGVVPLRPIRSREGGWWADLDRVCTSCDLSNLRP
jgi:hypothetical protein